MAELIAPPVPAGDFAPGAPEPLDQTAPAAQAVRRTIVVGLGNPVLGDDAVGWRVADLVEAGLVTAREIAGPVEGDCPDVDVERLGVGGLRLMEFLEGYDAAILVDAAEFADRPIGEVRSCALDDLDCYAAGHLDSAHDASLVTALALGRRLGASLPANIQAVTVQIHSVDEFSEQLTPAVEAAVPVAAAAVFELLASAGR